jgi:hypothetical protein
LHAESNFIRRGRLKELSLELFLHLVQSLVHLCELAKPLLPNVQVMTCRFLRCRGLVGGHNTLIE